MAYNNAFPVGYQPAVPYPLYSPYQPYQPYQPQSLQNSVNQPAQQTAPQMMTPPTIHAEIVQVDGEQAAAQYPVGAGVSQMMISKDDSAIFVKTALANGQYTLDIFDKRPPAPPAPSFDPSAYVTWDKLDERVASILAASQATARVAEKEGSEE